jgi:hypothetical protein
MPVEPRLLTRRSTLSSALACITSTVALVNSSQAIAGGHDAGEIPVQ